MTDLLLPPSPTLFPATTVQKPQQLPVFTSDLLLDAVERLRQDFDLIPLAEVVDVVAGCLRDLQVRSPGALPELTERLARQRLSEYVQLSAERA